MKIAGVGRLSTGSVRTVADGRPTRHRVRVFTAAAKRSTLGPHEATVLGRRQFDRLGLDAHDVDRQVAARRWQRFGPAVLLHNAEPTPWEYARICVLNCGPRAGLTSFTATTQWGVTGWERDEVHVLAPQGTVRPDLPRLVLHRVGTWRADALVPGRRLHRLPPAAVIAASSFSRARPGCGLLASVVQQRLASAHDLRLAVRAATRTRHRHAFLLALDDIEQGAEALSELDFVRLCRAHGLPRPSYQAVRRQPDGRRRYLDVEWQLGGRRYAVEVDGAHHMKVVQWTADQLRQNEVVIAGTPTLRFSAVVVRDDEHLVADQVRRFLGVR